MARHQQPMTEEELAAAREQIAEAFDAVREELDEAADEAVPDGGEG